MKEDIAAASCLVNADFHRYKWDGKGNSHEVIMERLASFSEELAELTKSLMGLHEHSPELELIQIGSMCINWLRQYPDEQIMQALKTTLEEHTQRAQQEFNLKDNYDA